MEKYRNKEPYEMMEALHFGHDLERQSASGVRMLGPNLGRRRLPRARPHRHQPALSLLLRTDYVFYSKLDVGSLSPQLWNSKTA